ncbi:MAG: DNA polymerase ligase N-terminal domain-containing protein [Candidatus Dormibacteria bacterium]
MSQGKATASGGLARYRAKRECGKTLEPSGRRQRPEGAPSRWDQLPKGHRFCVQLHRATRLHYDFRLEHQGVLLSWAVPKGPSMDPRQRRLALQVEDHPTAYGDFEDVIPSGYVAGTVLVWDTGSFAWEEGPKGKATEGLRQGHLDFRLQGERLRGGFSLIRMDRSQRSDKPQWLLQKRRDGEVGADGRRPETSVKTGRTLDQVAEALPAARPTHRDGRQAPTSARPKPAEQRSATARRRAS